MSVPSNDSESESRELRRILDEELQRLPEKYRALLVLCYLDGKTNKEAARLLRWPAGSISYRLARGLELLRERLEIRLAVDARLAGVAVELLPMVLMLDLLKPAAVPSLLVQTTAQAAAAVAGGSLAAAGVLSASVRDLLEAMLRELAPSRWRWLFTAMLIVLSLLSLGAAVYVASGSWSFHAAGSCSSPP